METVKVIPESDYGILENLVKEYLPGTDDIKSICRNYPAAVVGYYLDSALIGCAYGFASPWEGEKRFSLDGIAIAHPFNASGRGGKLLKFFERCVYDLSHRCIDLGSAGGYVERFYIKNGYTPIELKVLVEDDGWKEKQQGYAFPVAEIQTQGEYTKLVLAVNDYAAMDKDEITEYYGGVDSFFVFEKMLP